MNINSIYLKNSNKVTKLLKKPSLEPIPRSKKLPDTFHKSISNIVLSKQTNEHNFKFIKQLYKKQTQNVTYDNNFIPKVIQHNVPKSLPHPSAIPDNEIRKFLEGTEHKEFTEILLPLLKKDNLYNTATKDFLDIFIDNEVIDMSYLVKLLKSLTKYNIWVLKKLVKTRKLDKQCNKNINMDNTSRIVAIINAEKELERINVIKVMTSINKDNLGASHVLVEARNYKLNGDEIADILRCVNKGNRDIVKILIEAKKGNIDIVTITDILTHTNKDNQCILKMLLKDYNVNNDSISEILKYTNKDNKDKVKVLLDARNESIFFQQIAKILKYTNKDNKDMVEFLLSARNGKISEFVIPNILKYINKDNKCIVKKLLEARDGTIDIEQIPEILQHVDKISRHSLDYLLNAKTCNGVYLYDVENIPRFLIFFKNYPKTKELIQNPVETEQFYENMTSIADIRDKNGNILIGANGVINLLILKYNNPDKYSEMMKFVSLSQKGIIPEYIFNNLSIHGEIGTLVLEDVNKVVSKKDIIPVFSKLKDIKEILTETKLGDVISIEGIKNIFVNEGDRITSLEIDAQNYLKLLPPIKRFAWSQGRIGDCFAITVKNNIMINPLSRIKLYKMFKQDENDIIVTIPLHEDDPVVFPNGKIKLPENKKHITGPLGIQMLEQAYAQVKYKAEKLGIQISDDPDSFLDIDEVMNHIGKGGQLSNCFECLLGLNKEAIHEIPVNYNLGTDILFKEFDEVLNAYKDNKLINLIAANTPRDDNCKNLEFDIVGNHGYSIIDCDTENKALTIVNPWNTGVWGKISYEKFLEYFQTLNIINI